jgi:hypothetical protein
MTGEPKSTTMEKHETVTRSQPIVEQIDAWCAANGVSCYALFSRAGLSRSSMTWWRQGRTPNRGALICLEFAMAELEKKASKKKSALVEH